LFAAELDRRSFGGLATKYLVKQATFSSSIKKADQASGENKIPVPIAPGYLCERKNAVLVSMHEKKRWATKATI
jgi:hypothetical protein